MYMYIYYGEFDWICLGFGSGLFLLIPQRLAGILVQSFNLVHLHFTYYPFPRMEFTKEQIQTGDFSPEQLDLLRELFDQKVKDPFWVVSQNGGEHMRAIHIDIMLGENKLKGWLLVGRIVSFHLGHNSFWQKYTTPSLTPTDVGLPL